MLYIKVLLISLIAVINIILIRVKREKLIWLLIPLYIYLVLSITFGGRSIQSEQSFMLVPLRSYWGIIKYGWEYSAKYIFIECVGNVLMFIPLGQYSADLKKKKLFFLILVLCSLSIEVCQLIFGLGAFEVDDILHNTLGGLIGVSLVMLFGRKRELTEQEKKFWSIPFEVFGEIILFGLVARVVKLIF